MPATVSKHDDVTFGRTRLGDQVFWHFLDEVTVRSPHRVLDYFDELRQDCPRRAGSVAQAPQQFTNLTGSVGSARGDGKPLEFTLRAEAARRPLVVAVATLVAGTFVAQLMKWSDTAPGIARFFDADVKVNFPTGFKLFALGAAALLSYLVAKCAQRSGDQWTRHWFGLAAVMGFLFVDEMAYVHQSLASFLGGQDEASSGGGLLHFKWVIIYLPVALVVGALMLRFVLGLRPSLRWPLIVSGVLFAGGSGGVELLKGRLVTDHGEQSLAFMMTTAVSDSAEMIGLALFVYVMTGELARRTVGVRLELMTR